MPKNEYKNSLYEVNPFKSFRFRIICVFIEAFFPCRFGSELVLVDSYPENNFTQHLAHLQLDHPTSSYWLGAVTLNDLNTNTLESAGGEHVSLYSGENKPTHLA